MNSETLADILSLMRSEPLYNPHGDPALVEANKVLKNYADRIEAAAQREKVEAVTIAATKAVNLTNEKWQRDVRRGNGAALRKALKYARDVLAFTCRIDWRTTMAWGELHDAIHKADAALDAPARNCDVSCNDRVKLYGDFKDWCRAKGHTMEPMLAYDAFDWLLAPAEGGAE